MPWVRATLRGQLVYARVDADGELMSQAGRVEIRYKPHDGRAYRAAARNLEVTDPKLLPDDVCGPAESGDAAKKAAKKTPKAASSPKGAGAASAGAAGEAGEAAALPADCVIAYTDGACSGNPGPAGLGVVVLDGDRCIERYEYLGHGTNNIAELTAVLRALEEIDPARSSAIHTDSKYSIGVLQKGWKAKANKELIAELRATLQKHPRCRLIYVPGHAGVPLNERADELARSAIGARSSKRVEKSAS